MESLTEHSRFRFIHDVLRKEVYDVSKVKPPVFLVNNLATENINLRAENTRLKLILLDIVQDLEKEANKREPIIIRKIMLNGLKRKLKLMRRLNEN